MLDVGVEETMMTVLQIFLPHLALDQLMDTDPDLVRLLQILNINKFFREIKVVKKTALFSRVLSPDF